MMKYTLREVGLSEQIAFRSIIITLGHNPH